VTFKPITKEIKRPSFAVYDLEWWPENRIADEGGVKLFTRGDDRYRLEPRIVGFYDGSRYQAFTTIDDFFTRILTGEYNGWWIYAHAGGLADFTFLLPKLLEKGYRVEMRFSSAAAVFVEVSRGRYKWFFVDSFFLLRTKLRKIGEALGLAKGGADGSLDMFRAPLPILISYNEQDCIILYKAIEGFARIIMELGGELKATVASCALTLFLRKYLKRKVKTRKDHNELLREAYVASRVEVFRRRGKDLYQWDINSSFPASMTKPCPGEYQKTTKRPPEGHDLFFADVTFDVPHCPDGCDLPKLFFPPLPLKRDGKVYFPTGKWRAWVSGPDFRLAEELGCVSRVHSIMVYDERDDLAGYVHDIYARRVAATDEYMKEVLKILLNSLYGKWGEGEEKEVVLVNPRSRAEVAVPGAEMLAPGVWKIPIVKDIPHQHIPWAATITARSRRLIYDGLIFCPDALYCDTDCVVTHRADMPSSDRLGDYKLEAKIDEGYFVAPKMYQLLGVETKDKKTGQMKKIDKVKAKGFSGIKPHAFPWLVDGNLPRVDLESGGADDDWNCAPCTDVKTRKPALAVRRMTRLKEIARLGLSDPVDRSIIKGVHLGDDKRCFDSSGSSRPWKIEEISEDD